MLDRYPAPVGAEFVRDDACQRRADVLAHFGLGDVDEHTASAVNFKPYRRRKALARTGRKIACRVFAAAARQHRAEAHDQGSAGGGSKEGAAADSRCLFWHCHDYALPPFAAFFIAFFIRGYAMQRHRLPFMAWLMSSSLGFGLFASRSAACMICPDWQ